MKTKGEAFAGLSVAMVTPFKDGEVDYDAFREQIEFQIAAGTNCMCPVGTTGESPTLTPRRARAGDRVRRARRPPAGSRSCRAPARTARPRRCG